MCILQDAGKRQRAEADYWKMMRFRKLGKVCFLKRSLDAGHGRLMNQDGRKQKFDCLTIGQKTARLANMKRLTARISRMTQKYGMR